MRLRLPFVSFSYGIAINIGSRPEMVLAPQQSQELVDALELDEPVYDTHYADEMTEMVQRQMAYLAGHPSTGGAHREIGRTEFWTLRCYVCGADIVPDADPDMDDDAKDLAAEAHGVLIDEGVIPFEHVPSLALIRVN